MPDMYVSRQRVDTVVTFGTPKVVHIASKSEKIGILAKIGAGGTVTVETTMSSPADIATGGAAVVWQATAIAASAVSAHLVLDNVYTAVRLSAAVANGTFAIIL